MPGKADIYNLGEKGVNRVKSPVHLVDGELTTAQNAQIIPYHGQRALAKRRGMTLLNATTAAAGAIMNFFRVSLVDPDPTDVDPVPSPDALMLYIPWNTVFRTYHKFPPDTPDLTSASWLNISEQFENYGLPGEQNLIFRLPSTGSVVWYPATERGGTWEQYDANTDTTASGFTLPSTGSNGSVLETHGWIRSYCTDGTNIYVSADYGGTFAPVAVYKCEQDGTVTLVGQEFSYAGGTGPGGIPRIDADHAGEIITWWNGRLWTVGIDTDNYATFEMVVYSIDPATESVWTLDHHEANTDEYGTYVPSVNGAGDYLYACFFTYNLGVPRRHVIFSRSTGGTWTKRIEENISTSLPYYDYTIMRAIYGSGSTVLLTDPYRQLWSTDALATWTTASTNSTWRYYTDVLECAGKLYYATWELSSPWTYRVHELSTAGVSSEVTSKSVSTSLRALLLGEV
jgi:hypothetical protein